MKQYTLFVYMYMCVYLFEYFPSYYTVTNYILLPTIKINVFALRGLPFDIDALLNKTLGDRDNIWLQGIFNDLIQFLRTDSIKYNVLNIFPLCDRNK